MMIITKMKLNRKLVEKRMHLSTPCLGEELSNKFINAITG
jgi:hypothetical protein